jgi:anti-sigma factor RsiW
VSEPGASGPHLGDRLSALVDGELDAAAEAVARSHLAACEACTGELAATARVRDLVRGLPAVEPLSRLDLVGAGRRGGVAGLVAAVAAAVALVLMAGVQADRPDTPPVGRLVEVHATSVANADPVSQMAPAAVPVSMR